MSEFSDAVISAMEDHKRYGHIDTGSILEDAAMRVVGISRADSLRLMHLMHKEFADDFQRGDPDLANALLAVIEIALAVGVHLERKRFRTLDPG